MIDYENGFEACSESKAMWLEDPVAEQDDRAAFVRNVGRLAAQTREGVVKVEYSPETATETELAIIHYKGGTTKEINIRADSYSAIVRDIFKYI